jgi:hypothetical protein
MRRRARTLLFSRLNVNNLVNRIMRAETSKWSPHLHLAYAILVEYRVSDPASRRIMAASVVHA